MRRAPGRFDTRAAARFGTDCASRLTARPTPSIFFLDAVEYDSPFAKIFVTGIADDGGTRFAFPPIGRAAAQLEA